ncbi:hypothetical protein [Riemerella anatipestifer]|nr:hypothetical protein [Riemerella anatipestifer]MDR7730749.1 hypothetical protein [Riemerella anatipestifer]
MIIIIIGIMPMLFSSQRKVSDTVYIEFDNTKDKHYEHKKKINYFEIDVNDTKKIHFQYGIYNVRTVKKFNKKIINRTCLSKIIKNDNAVRRQVYIIVKKIGSNYYKLYSADHIFRTIID